MRHFQRNLTGLICLLLISGLWFSEFDLRQVTASSLWQSVPCQNFGLQMAMPLGSINSNEIALADLNQDGWLDVLSSQWSSSVLTVYLRNAPGAFAAPLESVMPVSRAQGLRPGDFNGDGKTDIALFNTDNTTLHLWLGDSTGRFGNIITGKFAAAPLNVLVADINAEQR